MLRHRRGLLLGMATLVALAVALTAARWLAPSHGAPDRDVHRVRLPAGFAMPGGRAARAYKGVVCVGWRLNPLLVQTRFLDGRFRRRRGAVYFSGHIHLGRTSFRIGLSKIPGLPLR